MRFRAIALFKPYDVLCQFSDVDGRVDAQGIGSDRRDLSGRPARPRQRGFAAS